MSDSEFSIGKQMELYSNAIIAFLVFQGIGFCYQFGTSATFYGVLRTDGTVAKGLAVMFLLVLAGALYATLRISRVLEGQAADGEKLLVRKVFIAKQIVVFLFGVLPLGVTLGFTACVRTGLTAAPPSETAAQPGGHGASCPCAAEAKKGN
jgi:hypothetical protein